MLRAGHADDNDNCLAFVKSSVGDSVSSRSYLLGPEATLKGIKSIASSRSFFKKNTKTITIQINTEISPARDFSIILTSLGKVLATMACDNLPSDSLREFVQLGCSVLHQFADLLL
jgi:hypothetical protein